MMQTIEERIRDWVAERFEAIFPGTELGSDVMEVRATANEDHGDYQCNAAMRLAKPLRFKPLRLPIKWRVNQPHTCPGSARFTPITSPSLRGVHCCPRSQPRFLEGQLRGRKQLSP